MDRALLSTARHSCSGATVLCLWTVVISCTLVLPLPGCSALPSVVEFDATHNLRPGAPPSVQILKPIEGDIVRNGTVNIHFKTRNFELGKDGKMYVMLDGNGLTFWNGPSPGIRLVNITAGSHKLKLICASFADYPLGVPSTVVNFFMSEGTVWEDEARVSLETVPADEIPNRTAGSIPSVPAQPPPPEQQRPQHTSSFAFPSPPPKPTQENVVGLNDLQERLARKIISTSNAMRDNTDPPVPPPQPPLPAKELTAAPGDPAKATVVLNTPLPYSVHDGGQLNVTFSVFHWRVPEDGSVFVELDGKGLAFWKSTGPLALSNLASGKHKVKLMLADHESNPVGKASPVIIFYMSNPDRPAS